MVSVKKWDQKTRCENCRKHPENDPRGVLRLLQLSRGVSPSKTTKSRSHATTVAHPPTAAANDHDDSDPVMDMHPIARTSAAPRRARHWTPEEDVTLTSSAVTFTFLSRIGSQLPRSFRVERTNSYKRWKKS